MRVTIENLNLNEEKLIGFVPMPSFPVSFRSSMLSGEARFVPASDPSLCIGEIFDVEISQDAISGFEVLERSSAKQRVAMCPEVNGFTVHGVVSSIEPISEPAGQQLIVVMAGEARFLIGRTDIGAVALSVGDAVGFVAHEVALWDEAI